MTSDADLIRHGYTEIAAGDLQAFSRRLHPDIVWDHNPGGGSPEEGSYRGRDSVVHLLERIIEPWEHIRAVPEDLTRLEEGAYLVRGELRAKHSTTENEIVTRFEQRLELDDGQVTRVRMSLRSPGTAEPAPAALEASKERK